MLSKGDVWLAMKDYKFLASTFLKQGKEFSKLDIVEEVFSRVSINDIIAVSYLLMPDFVQINDYSETTQGTVPCVISRGTDFFKIR